MELAIALAAIVVGMWAAHTWSTHTGKKAMEFRRIEFHEAKDVFRDSWAFDFVEMSIIHLLNLTRCTSYAAAMGHVGRSSCTPRASHTCWRNLSVTRLRMGLTPIGFRRDESQSTRALWNGVRSTGVMRHSLRHITNFS